MACKSTSRKRETTLVPHRAPNLSSFLPSAQREAAVMKGFLDAGGSPSTLVDLTYGDKPVEVPLLQAVVILDEHPHSQLAECVQLLVQSWRRYQCG
jgi:hypothetical protein